MKNSPSSIWNNLFNGNISRIKFLLYGSLLLLLKTNLDWFIAHFIFHKNWNYFWTPDNHYYLLGDTYGSVESLLSNNQEMAFNFTLLLFSLPFMLLGLSLTVKRLNGLKTHPWLLVLFFIPYIQLLFFGLLGLLPSEKAEITSSTKDKRGDWLSPYLPKNPFLAAIAAAGLTALFGGAMVLFSTDILRIYGGFLFVGLPFCLGFLSTLLYKPKPPASFKDHLVVSLISLVFVLLILLIFAIEGVVCILMASPLAVGLAALGVCCARAINKSSSIGPGTTFLLIGFLLPGLMGFESVTGLKPTEWHVTSSVVIKASPEKVWKTVIAFPDITEPKELIFQLGISYPTHATIQGKGVGAMRRCHFNTGDFLEPITQWDEPKVLGFEVVSEPEPMTELSFYNGLRPPHLDGYFISNRGQFKLTPLPDDSTLLEGITWYTHAIWPETYWHLWSDEIIHRIHLRVLNHIKNVVEVSSKV